MTKDEFKELKPGDIVRRASDREFTRYKILCLLRDIYPGDMKCYWYAVAARETVNDVFDIRGRTGIRILNSDQMILLKTNKKEDSDDHLYSSDDTLVVKVNASLPKKDFERLRSSIMLQKMDGTVLLPNFCEAMVVPKDIEVDVEHGEES